ncbi:helix-turn-helix domain-containing protein [Nocardioides sambongensis]|uniref:helix-turn-helix domain-containing protein n=1 Tax=Nocardioides sambongensis TaxID=2589074 RepID=UPI0011299CC9|nr:helix-turn-helix domain-containing protein [Nocardioides sambongensis]
MVDEYISVSEAADLLGVNRQRIHQRILEGSLPARRVGTQWTLPLSSVRRLQHHGAPGRPLSPKSAWDMILVAAGVDEARALPPSARSRARSRLASLLNAPSDTNGDLDAGAARLRHALHNRAERVLFAASPRDLADLADDDRVLLSGVSNPAANISAADVVEGYVVAEDVEALIDDYLLSSVPSPASGGGANVIFHVVRPGPHRPEPALLERLVSSALPLAADLAEHDGVREKNEALHRVSELGDRVRFRTFARVESDRG